MGVPEIIPVEAPSVSPDGRFPEEIDHIYAGVPPLACSCVEYAMLAVAEGKEEVAIASSPLGEDGVEVEGVKTAIEALADTVCAGLAESVAVTVKLYVPLCAPLLLLVGVPEIAPVDAFNTNPAGRLPDEIVHV